MRSLGKSRMNILCTRTTPVVALFVCSSYSSIGQAAFDPQTVLQLADYVAVDYPEAVVDGTVVDEAEYAEMQEFGARIAELTRELEQSGRLAETAAQLGALIAAKAPAERIAVTCRTLRQLVLAEHPVDLTPPAPPDLERGAELYQAVCSSCHGSTGRGDGPLAENLDPPPTDFRDHRRAAQRSLYGLYNTITLGVAGTSMAPFSQLPDVERWALAFYVGGLTATDEEIAVAARLFVGGAAAPSVDLRTLTSSTLNEIGEQFGPTGAALALYLRRQPQSLFASKGSPFDVAREQTALAVARFRAGDRPGASSAALSAYLDGFELVESSVAAVDAGLMRRIEAEMSALRGALDDRDTNLQAVEQRAAAVFADLAEASSLIDATKLTPLVVFTSALVILLREGLEAILILAAIAAFMIKTSRRDALKYLHAGWIAALALGVATWAVSTWLLAIGGATRELTEGLTALFAALVLFYVGFWMHNKLSARRWSEFLREHVGKALEGGTLWTLTLVSFVAVYREVFETVLFYQALWAQTGGTGQAMVFGGAGVAAALLVLFSWLIFRLGVRLPLRQFFGASAAVMIVLAVVFAGKGVAALQEAGRLPSDAIALLPRIELLGIYPTWQSVGAQLALIAIAVALVMRNRRGELERN